MKTLLSMKMLLLSFALALPILAQPEGDDLLPARWFENIPATDDSIQRTLVFKSTAGVLYTVETSNNLTDWNTEETFYGLGHDVLVPMYEYTPPPPPPPGTPPAELPPRPLFASLTLRREASPGTGTIVSWRSLEGGAPIITRIDTALHPDWENQILHTHQANGYHLFIFGHYQAEVATPTPLPTLTTADQTLLDHVAAHLPAINLQVENATAIARAAPPPAPQSGQKQFWRIKADWSLDSDGDGTPDWLEFENIQLAPGPGGLAYDPFDDDTDNDAMPDGWQMDADQDGVTNASDPAPKDSEIATERLPRWRYAVFSLPSRTDSNSQPASPLMISGEGKVLYQDAIWHNGNIEQLPLENPDEISNAGALSINDQGNIIGIGAAQRQPTGGGSGGSSGGGLGLMPMVMAWWETHTANPIIVESDGRFAELPSFPENTNYFPYDSVLSTGGNFFADVEFPANQRKRVMVERSPSASGGFQFNDDEQFNAEGFDPLFARGYSDPLEFGEFWGSLSGGSRYVNYWNSDDFESFDLLRVKYLHVAEDKFTRVLMGRGGKVYFMKSVENVATWVISPKLIGTHDLSENGVRLIMPHTMAQDTRRGITSDWAPDLLDHSASTEWINSSTNGWILARKGSDEARVFMPVLFEDTEEYTGVDSFSLSGTGKFNPKPKETDGTQEKSWIMVPKGGDPNEFKLHSLAGNGNTLTVEAPGLLFGNATDTTEVTTPVTTLSLSASAESESVSSGAEINLNLRLGTGADSISMPLAAKVMKRRTVRVGLFRVSGMSYQVLDPETNQWTPATKAKYFEAPPESRQILDQDHPTTVPNEAELEEYLNEVFTPQINIDFDVTLFTQPITSGFNENGGAATLSPAKVVTEDPVDDQPPQSNYLHSEEQAAIHAETAAMTSSNPQNIHVYFIGRPTDPFSYGITIRNERTCWIDSSYMMPTKDQPFLLETIAHEIGHVLVGNGHPNDGTNQFTLPGTAHHKRLMRSGELNRPDPGHLLVKHEWDAAERWLTQEEDDGRLDP
jgi:hypothetical protein